MDKLLAVLLYLLDTDPNLSEDAAYGLLFRMDMHTYVKHGAPMFPNIEWCKTATSMHPQEVRHETTAEYDVKRR